MDAIMLNTESVTHCEMSEVWCGVQVLTNAGQANAATGDQGYEDAVNCATLAAATLGVSPDDVLLMSTGAFWRAVLWRCCAVPCCVIGGCLLLYRTT
jgi:N-acetylglutamate synthase/N-acetylornithine aminotransferase